MQKSALPAAAPVPVVPRGRGRPRAFDREAALGQATCLFWRKGFEATSMADLTAAMGIGAPSLYAAFGSKEALYAESLQHYQRQFGGFAWGGFDAANTARDAVAGLLADSAAALTGGPGGAQRGCMITLSAVDGESHAELCNLVREARDGAFERLKQRFESAVQTGELAPSVDLNALARFVQTVQSGMSILARDGASRADLEAVGQLAMRGWDAAVQAPRHSEDT